MHKAIITSLLLLLPGSAVLAAEEIQLQENAPERHVVVKGDTLWGIAGKFLKDPWRWPQVWNLNREQIRNPHRIYPGNVVVLDRSSGEPRLRLEDGGVLPTVKLSPNTRTSKLEDDAIAAIPASEIAPFINRPLVIDERGLEKAPYLAGPVEERLIMGAGDRVYAVGVPQGKSLDWQIYRAGRKLTDPQTGEVLGFEAEHLGDTRVIQPGKTATMEIVRSGRDIRAGDRLLPTPEARFTQYIPHAPEKPVTGQIISAYGNLNNVGQYATVVINRGSRDGVEEGHVLGAFRKGALIDPPEIKPPESSGLHFLVRACVKPGKTITFSEPYDPAEVLEECPKDASDPEREVWAGADISCLRPGVKASFDQPYNPRDTYRVDCPKPLPTVEAPDSRSGLIFIYRVFDRVSYGLVMSAVRPIFLLDAVRNP